jgi:hypothetical protein
MKYITPHSTDIMAQRNVIPYLEYPRFITSGLPSIANATTSEVDGVGLVINPVPVQLQSQTFTFNQVPDKLIIYVRPDSTYRNDATYNDFVLPINAVSIQWNNHAGILANASQEQLFHMSQEAGSNQNWLDFIGYANANSQRLAGTLSEVFQVYPYDAGTTVAGVPQVAQNGVIPNQVQLPTVGSYLMLDMARHLELTESYYAPGSLGSFQLQFSINVLNTILNDGTNISVNPEIVVIPVNSGLMVTERGQTSCYTGILTKQDVLDASLQEPLSHLHESRVVGRGHQDSGRSLPKHILPGMTRKNFAPASNASMDKRLM